MPNKQKPLEDRVKQDPRIDPDLSPHHPANREAARKLRLRFNPRSNDYRDSDGAIMGDKYGQPLG